MTNKKQYVGFNIDKQQFALPLVVVKRIVHLVEICPLPNTPAFISGVINYHGQIIPVINMRLLFGLKSKNLALSDQLIITESNIGFFALLVDSASGIFEVGNNDIISSHKINYGDKYIKGAIKLTTGITLITQVDKFLRKEALLELESIIDNEYGLKK